MSLIIGILSAIGGRRLGGGAAIGGNILLCEDGNAIACENGDLLLWE